MLLAQGESLCNVAFLRDNASKDEDHWLTPSIGRSSLGEFARDTICELNGLQLARYCTKNVFAVHGVNEEGSVQGKRKGKGKSAFWLST